MDEILHSNGSCQTSSAAPALGLALWPLQGFGQLLAVSWKLLYTRISLFSTIAEIDVTHLRPLMIRAVVIPIALSICQSLCCVSDPLAAVSS